MTEGKKMEQWVVDESVNGPISPYSASEQFKQLEELIARFDYKAARLFACDCAERVLPKFNGEFLGPHQERLQNCINVSRRFAYGDATEEGLLEASANAHDVSEFVDRVSLAGRIEGYASPRFVISVVIQAVAWTGDNPNRAGYYTKTDLSRLVYYCHHAILIGGGTSQDIDAEVGFQLRRAKHYLSPLTKRIDKLLSKTKESEKELQKMTEQKEDAEVAMMKIVTESAQKLAEAHATGSLLTDQLKKFVEGRGFPNPKEASHALRQWKEMCGRHVADIRKAASK